MTLSSTSAFRQLIKSIALLDHDAEERYLAAWKCSNDLLEQHLEPFNRTFLISYTNYVEKIGHRSGWGEAEILLQSVATSYEQKCGESDPRYWRVLISLAWSLFFQERFEEAEEIGEDIIQCAKNAEDNSFVLYHTYEGPYLISWCQYRQFKINLALLNLKHALKLSIELYGEEDGRNLNCSLALENWLLEWGQQEEATALAARRSQILGPPEIEELIVD